MGKCAQPGGVALVSRLGFLGFDLINDERDKLRSAESSLHGFLAPVSWHEFVWDSGVGDLNG
jgi:hypothetical protein